MYRVIAKMLAVRVATVLPDLISWNQTTFIKGRRIVDNIVLVQESVAGVKCKSSSRRAMWSIDFKKAFDCLRWDATDQIMASMGFDAVKRDVSFATLIEGSPLLIFTNKRGLRQGGPLPSCYLSYPLCISAGS